MSATAIYFLTLLGGVGVGAWFFGQGQAVRLRLAAGERPHSRAPYHGALCAAFAMAGAVPALVLARGLGAPDLLSWLAVMVAGGAGALLAARKAGPQHRARERAERLARALMWLAASLSGVITLGIVVTLVAEAALFFADVSVLELLFGTRWSPQTALRGDQVGQDGTFGGLPVFAGSLLIAALALAMATPVGIMIAIYLSEYARPVTRRALKPALGVLSGIPPVVYGVFALIAIGPAVQALGGAIGLDVPVQSALAAAIAMALMVLPLISALSDDVLRAVPQSARDASSALGATPSETITRVVLPQALPGLSAAVLLAVGRAIGETMIVVIAAGRAANLTLNPLESVTTVTVQIVALLTGDQVFDSAKTRAAFALGLALFALTLLINGLALRAVRRFRRATR